MVEKTRIDDTQLLAQFSQMFRTITDSFMDRVDIHRGQGLLLCTIVNKDGMTQTEIAEMLSVQGATVTNMLQRMEESGLVIRRRDPEDNRLVRVYATDVARQKELALSKHLRDLETIILRGIDEQERDTLRRLLWQMIHNMESTR